MVSKESLPGWSGYVLTDQDAGTTDILSGNDTIRRCTEMTPIEQEELGHCLAAIVQGLKLLDYQHPQYTGFSNTETGQIILADSPSGKTKFAIGVKIWEPIK